jgi:hypothetical protein
MLIIFYWDSNGLNGNGTAVIWITHCSVSGRETLGRVWQLTAIRSWDTSAGSGKNCCIIPLSYYKWCSARGNAGIHNRVMT